MDCHGTMLVERIGVLCARAMSNEEFGLVIVIIYTQVIDLYKV